MSQRLYVLYGLNEGPVLGRTFIRACEQAGFELTQDLGKANIIFAHSGGCYLVPADATAQIIMVGIPYWPGRPLLSRLYTKVRRERHYYRNQRQTGKWIIKLCIHLRYTLNLKDAFRMAKNQNTDSPWNNASHQLIIRNQHDTYCTPAITEVTFRGPRSFLSLPGEHDDCWTNPEPYIRLLQLAGKEESTRENSKTK